MGVTCASTSRCGLGGVSAKLRAIWAARSNTFAMLRANCAGSARRKSVCCVLPSFMHTSNPCDGSDIPVVLLRTPEGISEQNHTGNHSSGVFLDTKSNIDAICKSRNHRSHRTILIFSFAH
jgi:hypothetical protein